MNESDQIETLKALTEVARERERPQKSMCLASVRVSPGSYLAVASVLTFTSALLLHSNRDLLALAAIGMGWVLVPVLALSDRIEFDGDYLCRRGPGPFVLRLISGRRKQIRLTDFERVETHATRTLRRGGRVRYRYRTQIVGKCTEFTFASGGRGYRQMVERLFPLIHSDKMDLRTLELRDYLCDPKTLNAEVRSLQLASDEVLDGATLDFKLAGQQKERAPDISNSVSAEDTQRATLLGVLGNKLRIAGRLNEAREAFRRSLSGSPADGRIIFEFARLLRSQAASLSDSRLLSRSRAAMRLSAMRAGRDANLHALIGEGFLEWGETGRAQASFQRAVELQQENVRARIGLASLALREGKLAHVIHQFRDAARSTSERALLEYTRREADYYARLNDDDDYLSSELRRINWLQHSLRIRRLAARVTNASILGALVGPYIDPAVAGVCWSLATSSLAAWILSLFAIKFLGKRTLPKPA